MRSSLAVQNGVPCNNTEAISPVLLKFNSDTKVVSLAKAPQAKIFRSYSDTKGILRRKMSAAGDFFGVF